MMLKPDYTHLGDSQASQVSDHPSFVTFTYFRPIRLILLFDEDDSDIVTPSWTTSFFELIYKLKHMIYVKLPYIACVCRYGLLLVLMVSLPYGSQVMTSVYL
jgi:hypothetical protein